MATIKKTIFHLRERVRKVLKSGRPKQLKKLNERMEKFRIGYGVWEHTYSFEDYEQLVK